jgi:ABC-type multidrug transport system fused ATPase/permease subunit
LVKNPQNPKIPEKFTGHIKIENVTFAYPKNKKVNILNNLSM